MWASLLHSICYLQLFQFQTINDNAAYRSHRRNNPIGTIHTVLDSAANPTQHKAHACVCCIHEQYYPTIPTPISPAYVLLARLHTRTPPTTAAGIRSRTVDRVGVRCVRESVPPHIKHHNITRAWECVTFNIQIRHSIPFCGQSSESFELTPAKSSAARLPK